MKDIIIQSFTMQKVTDKGQFDVPIVTLGKRNSNGVTWATDIELLSAQVEISAYNHRLMDEEAAKHYEVNPAGVAKVVRQGNMLVLQGHFYTETPEGAGAYERSKLKQENGYDDEWSIAAAVKDSYDDNALGWVLQTVKPLEAGSVIAGADAGAKLRTIQSDDGKSKSGRSMLWLPVIGEVYTHE